MTGLEHLTIVHLTQHWFRDGGTWFREAWVRDADGCLRFVGIRDDLLTGGAL